MQKKTVHSKLITEGKQGHTLKPHENTFTKMNLNRIKEVEKSLQKIEEKIKIPCNFQRVIHRIHKWRTRGKKLVPSHESEALEDKQKLQMKTFSELAECLALIPPKITFYGLLFKYNYVGCLLLVMFSSDLLFAIKRDAYLSRKQDDFVGFRSIDQKLEE